jgi:hypothetical protein
MLRMYRGSTQFRISNCEQLKIFFLTFSMFAELFYTKYFTVVVLLNIFHPRSGYCLLSYVDLYRDSLRKFGACIHGGKEKASMKPRGRNANRASVRPRFVSGG